ncbi:SDH family Clp fold serine proteinase [Sphingobacterium hungaricum]
MGKSLNEYAQTSLKEYIEKIENNLNADVLVYYGPFVEGLQNSFARIVEELASDPNKKSSIFIVLTTTGGSAEVVERYVNILRHHYDEVNFIVPDYAYSAGTIFCMSGDNIYMDYLCILGPIDPQVINKDGKFVPALGYLDKINDLLEKARDGSISDSEFLILRDFDLAELRGYEQAKDLTIALLKKWLVKYKFKNWTVHRTNSSLIGTVVTENQKEKRATEIADDLSNNNKWKSHARPINIHDLKELKLEIEDYSNKTELRDLIRDYYELMDDYVRINQTKIFINTRNFI